LSRGHPGLWGFALCGLLLLASCARVTQVLSPAPAARTATPAPPGLTTPWPPTAEPTEPTPIDPFGVNWNDLSVFDVELVSSEKAVIGQLADLTVYHLDLTISDDLSAVSGRGQVRYINTEADRLDEVHFRLYPNLLGGSMTVSDVTVDGASVRPAYSLEDSLMAVPLAAPLEPGGSIVVEIEFQVAVPGDVEQNYGILSHAESVLSYAHGYPVICLYAEDGWNAQIPSQWGDITVADAAYYLVRISAPAALQIVTSGSQLSQTEDNGRQSVVVAAGPARDFYFAASRAFERTQRRVGEVTVRLFAALGEDARTDLALDTAEASLQVYSTHYGSYPYTELDLVTTPTYALGVEYPGVVALNEHMFTLDQDLKARPEEILLESTVAHEVAHQWFYNTVGNDQLGEPWLDEAMAQYATWQYYRDAKGAVAARAFEGSLRGRWQRVDNEDIPIGMPVSSYDPSSYGAIVYGRGPLFVDALRQKMGDAAFDAFILDYALVQRWKVATTEEFRALAENHCACDLTGMFEEWLYP
jgi:peptidase M1-like protein